MRKALLIIIALVTFFSGYSQYNPLVSTVFNKPVGIAQAIPADARSYYYDGSLFLYRPYQSTAEVLSYLTLDKYRTGQFPVFINIGGTLNGDGTFTGGNITPYYFKNGTADSNLVPFLNYNDLVNKPTIPVIPYQLTATIPDVTGVSTTFPAPTSAMASIIIDATSKNMVDSGGDVFLKYNIQIGMALDLRRLFIGNFSDNTSTSNNSFLYYDYYTLNKKYNGRKGGIEFGFRTVNQDIFTITADSAETEQQLLYSKKLLLTLGRLRPGANWMIAPQSSVDDKWIPAIQRYYPFLFRTNTFGLFNFQSTNPYQLNRISLDSAMAKPWPTVTAMIDSAKAQKAWIVFYGHDVYPGTTFAGPVRKSYLDSLCNYITSSGISVLLPSDAIQRLYPSITAGYALRQANTGAINNPLLSPSVNLLVNSHFSKSALNWNIDSSLVTPVANKNLVKLVTTGNDTLSSLGTAIVRLDSAAAINQPAYLKQTIIPGTLAYFYTRWPLTFSMFVDKDFAPSNVAACKVWLEVRYYHAGTEIDRKLSDTLADLAGNSQSPLTVSGFSYNSSGVDSITVSLGIMKVTSGVQVGIHAIFPMLNPGFVQGPYTNDVTMQSGLANVLRIYNKSWDNDIVLGCTTCTAIRQFTEIRSLDGVNYVQGNFTGSARGTYGSPAIIATSNASRYSPALWWNVGQYHGLYFSDTSINFANQKMMGVNPDSTLVLPNDIPFVTGWGSPFGAIRAPGSGTCIGCAVNWSGSAWHVTALATPSFDNTLAVSAIAARSAIFGDSTNTASVSVILRRKDANGRGTQATLGMNGSLYGWSITNQSLTGPLTGIISAPIDSIQSNHQRLFSGSTTSTVGYEFGQFIKNPANGAFFYYDTLTRALKAVTGSNGQHVIISSGIPKLVDSVAPVINGTSQQVANFNINGTGVINSTAGLRGNTSLLLGHSLVVKDTSFSNWGIDSLGRINLGTLYASHLSGFYQAANTTITAGAGAGTGPTVSITGSDVGGTITVTTGTSPSTSATVASITYSVAFATNTFPVLSCVNTNACTLTGATQVLTSGSSTSFILTSGSSALAASTTYVWNYVVTGK